MIVSRTTLYQDSRLTLIGGIDHVLGTFLQLYDKEMERETPEGEGLVYDWSAGFKTEVNLTGISNNQDPFKICEQYIKEINDNINLD